MFLSNSLDVMEPKSFFAPLRPKKTKMDTAPLNIMLVEDVHADALLTRIALDATNVPFSLTRLKRGDEVISNLRISKKLCPAEIPDLIMLDLGLPGMDGFEILAELSQMSSLIRSIPIVVVTSHQHFEYVQKTYPLFVMSYINKPCNSAEMRDVLLRIRNMKKNDRHA